MNRLGPETWLSAPGGRSLGSVRGDTLPEDAWYALLFVVFKWLPEMAAILAIGLILGSGYLIFLRGEIFQANAKLYVRVGIDQTPSPVLGSDRNVTFLAQTRGAVQSEMDLLRNEMLVRKLIHDLNLAAPEERPSPTGLIGHAKAVLTTAYRATREGLDQALVAIGLKTPVSREDAIAQSFAQSLVLDNAVGSDVISVSLRWPDQVQAVTLLDRFLQIYTNFRIGVFQGGGEIDFLQTKRDAARTAVEAIETDMAAFEREHDIRNATSRAPLLEADLVEAQRGEERQTLDLNLARRRLERLNRDLRQGVPGSQEPIGLGTFPANSPALGMAASIVSLLGERERLLVNNSASAPEVKEIDAKLNALVTVLRQQLDAEVQDLIRAETFARERVERVGAALRDLQASSNGWKSLERRRELAEARYRDAEKRLGEARDIAALRNARLSNVVVVQPAAVEGVPIGLRKLPMLTIIAFCAAVIAAGWALAREVFDTRLYRGSRAAADLGLPLAGAVPECRDLLSRQAGSGGGPSADACALALDRLVVTVDERLKAGHAISLAVAGARPGEGASTLALALALGIARRRGQRVLLATSREGGAAVERLRHSGADVNPLPGREGASSDPNLVTAGANLVCAVLPDRVCAPAWLSQEISARVEATLVVLDLPPILSDAEAAFAAGRADATLLVAAAGSRRAAIHREALEVMQRHGVEPVGLVLNRVRRIMPRAFEADP